MSSQQLDNGHYSAPYSVIRVVFGMTTAIVIPSLITTSLLYYKNIEKFPIKGRQPRLMLCGNVISLFGILLTFVFVWIKENFPCSVHQWGRLFIVTSVGSIYIIRCAVLVFKSHLTYELCREEINRINAGTKERSSYSVITQTSESELEATETQVTSKQPAGYFTTHRHWTSNANIVRGVVAVFLTLFIPGVAVFLFMDRTGTQLHECQMSGANIFLVAETLLIAGIYLILALQLREVVEGYHIKQELKITAIIASVLMLCVLLAIPQTIFPFHHLCYILLLGASSIVATLYPLNLYYQQKQKQLNDDMWSSEQAKVGSRIKLRTLEDVLNNNAALNLFKRHLASEFSIENYLFIAEVKGFKKDMEEIFADQNDIQTNNQRISISVDNNNNNNNDGDDSKGHIKTDSYSETRSDFQISLSNPDRSQKLQPPLLSKRLSSSAGSQNEVAWTAAYYIYQLFVSDSALCQVNLPFYIREQLRNVFTFTNRQSFDNGKRPQKNVFDHYDDNTLEEPLLESLDPLPFIPKESAPLLTLFDGAYASIIDLMNRDTFPRFVASEAFKNLRQQIVHDTIKKNVENEFSKL